jgi:hypothetical protein
MLVDFHGSVDPTYPSRLAERVARLLGCATADGAASVAIAQANFDYDRLAERAAAVIRG